MSTPSISTKIKVLNRKYLKKKSDISDLCYFFKSYWQIKRIEKRFRTALKKVEIDSLAVIVNSKTATLSCLKPFGMN